MDEEKTSEDKGGEFLALLAQTTAPPCPFIVSSHYCPWKTACVWCVGDGAAGQVGILVS